MNQILGQKRALDTLQSAIKADRLHHAYIFEGPAGVGKFTTACAFARVLLCHEPHSNAEGDVEACGVCESCRLIDRAFESSDDTTASLGGAHPDLHIVTKELAHFSNDATIRARKLTSIPVEVLRQSLLEPVYRAAQLGRRKVAIVDETHLLSVTGQNLLLKTLEEPPANTYIILVTAKQEQLLMTIRSRCHRIAFVPLLDEQVSQWLNDQGYELGLDQRSWLVEFAGGSLGQAKLAVSYDLFQWSTVVLPAIDRGLQGEYPIDLGEQMAEMINGFAKQWVDNHDGASKEAANRLAAGLMWQIIGQHARHRIHESAAEVEPENLGHAESIFEPWLCVIDALSAAQQELSRNVNMGLVTEHLVSRMYAGQARNGQPMVT